MISFIRGIALPFTHREAGSLARDGFRCFVLRLFYLSRSTTKAVVMMCKTVIYSSVSIEHGRHVLAPTTAMAFMDLGEGLLHEMRCSTEIEEHLDSSAIIQSWSKLSKDQDSLPNLLRSVVEIMFCSLQMHFSGPLTQSIWSGNELRKSILQLRGAIYSSKLFRFHVLRPMMRTLSQLQNFTVHQHSTVLAFSFVVEDREVWRTFRNKGNSVHRLLANIALNLMRQCLKDVSKNQSVERSESLNFVRYVLGVVYLLLREPSVYLSLSQSEEMLKQTQDVLPGFTKCACEYVVDAYKNATEFNTSPNQVEDLFQDVARII